MQTGYSVIKVLLGNVPLTVDTVITNLDGARVWLKNAFDSKGRRIGVSACCPEAAPCAWHAAVGRLNSAHVVRARNRHTKHPTM